MKPPAFDYIAVATVDEAVAALVEAEGDGKLIAGGQSLMPMLNFRLAEPAILVDISKISDLSGTSVESDGLSIGALTRHVEIETSHAVAEHFPVLAEAVKHVAHVAIRNRGTIGGSLSHADPAAELPMMAVLLDAVLTIAGPDGSREVTAEEFFIGALTTDLEDEEMVTRITLPFLPQNTGWGFAEISRRSGDFALAAASATLSFNDGKVSQARLAVTGVDDVPLRIKAAEDALCGGALDDAAIATVCDLVREAVNPNSDAQASADYRRHLIGVLAARVLRAAGERAQGGRS